MAGLSPSATSTVGAAYVVDGACTACGACLLTCPAHAFAVGIPLHVRADRCTDCGECIEVCPVDAITRVADDHAAVARQRSVGTVHELHDRRQSP